MKVIHLSPGVKADKNRLINAESADGIHSRAQRELLLLSVVQLLITSLAKEVMFR